MIRIKRTFNLILTLALWFTMAQGAWAANEETVTWTMDGGKSEQTTLSGDYTLINTDGKEIHYSTTGSGIISNNVNLQTTNFRQLNGGFIEFTNLKGVVTKVEMSHFSFKQGGMQMYVGLDKDDTSTLLHIQGSNNDYDFPSSDDSNNQSVTFEGSVTASQNAHLKIMFSGSSSSESLSFKQGSIVVTYIPEDKVDHGHNFTSIVANGNVLTATCSSTDADHNTLYGGAGHHYTLTLNAADGMASYMNPVNASITPSVGDFNEDTQLGATCTVEYAPQGTTNWTTSAPATPGNYTARATVRINSTDYVLTANFSVIEGHYITNDYSQFSVNKSAGAMAGEDVIVTFTPQMGESLTTLTVTGDNTSLSIGSGIIDNGDNTYRFTMPNENVTLGGTFTFPMNADNFAQDGDTYTIKNADGWDYFCQRMDVDAELNGFNGKTVMLSNDIIVTKMAGNGRYPFKGTFDGDGHTLTFNYTADMTNCAPFCITDGATIRNLHATGLIEGGTWLYNSGLVGSASGKLTIENCRVSTQISSTVSGIANNGGFVGYLSSQYNQCYITGCVFDGLIYNPNYSGTTYGCGGFVGCFSEYGYAILEDCLFIEGQYDNNGSKCELLWGYDNNNNSTFFHRTNYQGSGKLTNCFFVATHFLKQGSPAVESTDAPANFAHFGTPTDHRFLKVYGHTMVFGGKYYTPIYGDLVEKYDYSGGKSYTIEYDDAPLGIPDITSPLWTEGLRYNRSFTAGKPVTIMLPFNFTRSRITLAHDNANPSGKFYEFKGIEEDLEHKWVAVMIEAGETLSNEVVETTLQANHPYLYVPNESTEYLDIYVGGTGISIFTEGNEGGEKETEYYYGDGMPWNHWMFKGTYQPRYWSDSENPEEIGKVYGFAGARKEVDGKLVEAGEFVRAKIGAKIRPTSCYLKWVEPFDYAPARGMTRGAAATEELPQSITVKLISANGETTAIGTLDTKTGEMTFDSEAWYTLDGVRLSGKPSTKGIYINNGKKVVIK